MKLSPVMISYMAACWRLTSWAVKAERSGGWFPFVRLAAGRQCGWFLFVAALRGLWPGRPPSPMSFSSRQNSLSYYHKWSARLFGRGASEPSPPFIMVKAPVLSSEWPSLIIEWRGFSARRAEMWGSADLRERTSFSQRWIVGSEGRSLVRGVFAQEG